MSGSFGAQTPALAGAASAFGAQADPIIQQAERLQTVKGTSATTGRMYSAQGDAYRQAVTGPLAVIIRAFGEKCITVGDNLTANQKDYEAADAAGASGLTSAGGGERS